MLRELSGSCGPRARVLRRHRIAPERARPWVALVASAWALAVWAAAACAQKPIEFPPEDPTPGPSEVALARFRERFPRLAGKLEARQPVHLLAVGDSVTRGFLYNEHRYSLLRTYTGVFAASLAKDFFFTGGVREIAPERGNPEKIEPSLGPEITIEDHTRNGADVFFAFAGLTTDGFDNDPDLVIINFGANDARRSIPLADYRAALDAVATLVRKRNADLLFVGPTPEFDLGDRIGLGMTRPYTETMREVAEQQEVFFADADQLLFDGLAGDEPFPATPEAAFGAVTARLRKFFDHGPDVDDLIHPNEAGHELLGRALGRAVMEGVPVPPVSVSGIVSVGDDGACEVRGALANTGAASIKGVLCPLPLGFVAEPAGDSPDAPVALDAGGVGPFAFAMRKSDPPNWIPAIHAAGFPGHEPVVHVPLLLVEANRATWIDFRAPLAPVGVAWGIGAAHNLGGQFRVACELVNPKDEPLEVDYTASWAGEERSGNATLEPSGRRALELTFDLPKAPVDRVRDRLVLRVRAGGRELVFERGVELCRNFGLGSRLPLFPMPVYRPGVTDESLSTGGTERPSVVLRPEADSESLFLTFDIERHELVSAGSNPAMIIDLVIDGRFFRERGTIGFSDILGVSFGAEDGDGEVKPVRLGAFGNGYDRQLDASRIRSSLETRPDGSRRATLTIPRRYFYRHPWDLGNGNSALGIRADVSFLSVDADHPDGFYPPSLRFLLVDPEVSRHDSRWLPMLELTSEPTGRWTVMIY